MFGAEKIANAERRPPGRRGGKKVEIRGFFYREEHAAERGLCGAMVKKKTHVWSPWAGVVTVNIAETGRNLVINSATKRARGWENEKRGGTSV